MQLVNDIFVRSEVRHCEMILAAYVTLMVVQSLLVSHAHSVSDYDVLFVPETDMFVSVALF